MACRPTDAQAAQRDTDGSARTRPSPAGRAHDRRVSAVTAQCAHDRADRFAAQAHALAFTLALLIFGRVIEAQAPVWGAGKRREGSNAGRWGSRAAIV